jgi:hypothetical protein
LIEISVGGHVVLRTWASSAQQIATLHVATIRRFRRGLGFPATLVGFEDDIDKAPAGYRTVWLHPSIPIVFDYGTDYQPVEIDESRVALLVEQMDSTELGVVIANSAVPTAFAG